MLEAPSEVASPLDRDGLSELVLPVADRKVRPCEFGVGARKGQAALVLGHQPSSALWDLNARVAHQARVAPPCVVDGVVDENSQIHTDLRCRQPCPLSRPVSGKHGGNQIPQLRPELLHRSCVGVHDRLIPAGDGRGPTSDTYRRFDPADYLDDIDDVAGYLQIALEESAEDPTAVPRALGVIARSGNMSELAKRVGMSRDGLYKALSDSGNPTWSTVLKVCDALGLKISFHAVA